MRFPSLVSGRRESSPSNDNRFLDAHYAQPLKVATIYLQGAHGLIQEGRRASYAQKDASYVAAMLRRFGLPGVASGSEPTDSDISAILAGPNVRTGDGLILPFVPLESGGTKYAIGMPNHPVRKYYRRHAVGNGTRKDHELIVGVLALTIHSLSPDSKRADPAERRNMREALLEELDLTGKPEAIDEYLDQDVLAINPNLTPFMSFARIQNNPSRY